MSTPLPPLRRRRVLGALAGSAALAGCAQTVPGGGAASGARIRIGVASCCDQTKPQPIWDAVLAEAPDFFVFAGDNVYASRQPFDVAELRAAYALQSRVANFQRLRSTLPHTAIWDDHDYGLNDGGADFAHREASKAAFVDFWQVPADDERHGRPGLNHVRWVEREGRRVQLIVLDARWWRSPLKRTDQRGAPGKERYVPDADSAKTMLGAEQWAWLEQRLREPADAHLVVSGVQLLAEGHGFESWSNLPLERERFFRTVKASGARGVVLASGDRHIGGLYQHAALDAGYALWEITSSGVTHPWTTANEPGPNRIGPLVRERHYGVVEFDFAAGELTLALRGEANQVLHAHSVPLAALQPA